MTEVTFIILTVHGGNLEDVPMSVYVGELLTVLAEKFPEARLRVHQRERVTGTEPDAEFGGLDEENEDEAQRVVRDARQTAFSRACLAA